MAKRQTTVRDYLTSGSALVVHVKAGLGALESSHRRYIDVEIRGVFGDSLALDAALENDHPRDNRWDYLLGVSGGSLVVGLEPHSAKDDEVQTVIKKRAAAIRQLGPHLKPGRKVREWFWVASGPVKFAPTGKSRLRLDQAGIAFVGRTLAKKHLDKLSA